MVRQVYEVRVRYGGQELAGEKFMTVIDLEGNADATADLLNRHLLGAVARNGGTARNQHMYTLDIHPVGAKESAAPVARWALPIAGEGL